MHPQAEALIDFWFSDAVRARWYKATEAFDAELRARYGALVQAARGGALDGWVGTPREALALVIALDQLPRNIYRGTAQSFASDDQALAHAKTAIGAGFDAQVDESQRIFFYLPFMHSEELAEQERCVALCEATGNPEKLRHARQHRDLIARFGRFPHRNPILGRTSTEAERVYLASDEAFRG